jgi:hypothetical protein
MSEEAAVGSAQLLFGGATQRHRYPNPDVAGGHIALIATNNNPVHLPPPALDRMQASLQKQIALSRRILRAEEQIAGTSSGLGDFLQDMSFDEADPVFICVGTGHAMRGTNQSEANCGLKALDK